MLQIYLENMRDQARIDWSRGIIFEWDDLTEVLAMIEAKLDTLSEGDDL